jgi:medium-chain acyl-[acyl-carrier-protein] hydrolase
MTQSPSNPWFFIPQPKPQAQSRLFCFHYAGGSATIFFNWAKALPESIELIAVQLPGRGNRFKETFITDMKIAVEDLSKIIPSLLDKPYMTFGHSLGSVLSFELVHELRRNNMNLPHTMILAGRGAPGTQRPRENLHDLSEQDFIKTLKEYNGIPDFVLNNQEMLDLFLPIIRADFTLLESYQYQTSIPLANTIIALAGKDDPKITIENVAKWSNHTSGNFTHHVLAGDHFFIKTSENKIFEIIKEADLKQQQIG